MLPKRNWNSSVYWLLLLAYTGSLFLRHWLVGIFQFSMLICHLATYVIIVKWIANSCVRKLYRLSMLEGKNRSRYPNLKGNWSTTRNAFVLISIEQTLANMLLAAISFLFLVKFGPTTCSTHQDSYFRGFVEDTILNTDWMTCLQACHNKASCISYNYGGKMKTCEMISDGVTNQCDSGKVIYSRGWVFHQIRVRTM